MGESTSRAHRRRLTVWCCGLAMLGTVFSVTPAGATKTTTLPGAPTIGTATADGRSIKVAFTKPAGDAGKHITKYVATCTSSDGGVTGTHTGRRSPVRVGDLTAGKTYTCAVAARNRAGVGPASAASNAVTMPTVPDAPTITSATPGAGSVTVAVTQPANDGGAKVDSDRVTCTSSDGGVTHSHDGRHSPITVRGLTGLKTYTCTVAARNKVGLGPESAPSNAVVTLATTEPSVPGTPTITSATAGAGSVTVAFTAPADDGGAHIDRYRVTCTSSDGGVTRSGDGHHSPVRVGHLTAAKTYTCTVAAHNHVGLGAPSAASGAVVPLAHS